MSVKKLVAGKHNCVGLMELPQETANVSPHEYACAAMLVYAGTFQAMDGEVEVTENDIDLLIQGHNERLQRAGEVADSPAKLRKMMPPLQLDHSTSAAMTVGRVTGKLYKGNYKPDGAQWEVPAAFCSQVMILGEENVPKARDGRWANISVGADFKAGVLSELSITPFPAAAGASLLKDGTKMASASQKDAMEDALHNDENSTDSELIDHFVNELGVPREEAARAVAKRNEFLNDLTGKKKLTEGKGPKMDEKLRKHLMEKEKLSAEDADKKLAEMPEDAKAKMSADIDDEQKKLCDNDGDDDDKAKLAAEVEKKEAEEAKKMSAKLTAARPNIVAMAKGLSKELKDTRLAARTSTINAKLTRLRAAGKITPAELKKMDLQRLAAASEGTLDVLFKAYEDREPVIDSRVHGTTRAVNLSKLQAAGQAARLMAEAKKDFGVKLSAEEEKAMEAAPTVSHSERVAGYYHKENLSKLEAMLADHKDKEAILAHVRRMTESMAQMSEEPVSSESDEKKMSALEENVNKLQTQFQSLITMIGDATGIGAAELTD